MPPLGMAASLGLGAPRSATSSGAPSGGGAASEQDVLDLSPLWWLDPAAANCFTDAGTTAVSSDGDDVREWHDKTSNNIDFQEPSASYRPAWRASGENGMPYVEYAGSERLYVPKASVGNFSTPMTMYFVIAAAGSATQHAPKIAQGISIITYVHVTAGTGYDNAIQSNFGASGDNVTWGEQTPTVQSLTTQIIQIEFAGTSLPVLRINGGSAATRVTAASAAAEDWAIAGSTNMFHIAWAAVVNSYDYIAIGDVTHDADVVFGHLGDKYDIEVEAVS